MSKVTIVFEDMDDGTVSMKADFVPEINPNDSTDDLTPAQYAGLIALQAASETGKEVSRKVNDE